MSLLDDLNSVEPKKPALAEWILTRTPEERAAFEKALKNPTVPSRKLVEIVRKHGGSTTAESIEQHRNRVAAR